MWRKDVSYLFPIQSQTSANDRLWLMHLFEHVRSHGAYRYIEIGSFLGGTLTPALLDESCTAVLSIDLRPKVMADSRNVVLNYSRTTAEMLELLKTNDSLELAKLTTFDGCASECDFRGQLYDLAFIDAEHTDEAVFRDFLAIYDHLSRHAICAFHDSNQVTAGLENVLAFLGYQRREFWFGVLGGSLVSVIFLDVSDCPVPPDFLGNACNWEEFKSKSRDQLLLEGIKNRCTVSSTFTLKERPVVPM